MTEFDAIYNCMLYSSCVQYKMLSISNLEHFYPNGTSAKGVFEVSFKNRIFYFTKLTDAVDKYLSMKQEIYLNHKNNNKS